MVGKKRWHRETQEDREALWPLSAKERYISVDIETDGPVPGLHSMLSLGAAAYNAWGQRVGRFSANLETLPDADTDDRTMAWWAGQPEAWNRARERARDPKTVMEQFHVFALGEGRRAGRPVMVAYPAAFDAMWVTWYLHRFTSGDPFRRRCIDLKTLAMQLLGGGYAAAAKRNMPPSWLIEREPAQARRAGETAVVVTHHAPSPRCVRPWFHGDPFNPAFASNLDALIERYEPALWIHGHMHDPVDERVGKTRILANPAGYRHENKRGFNPQLCVELDAPRRAPTNG